MHPSNSECVRWSDRRICAVAALAIAAVNVYGGLLPNPLEALEPFELRPALELLRLTRWQSPSASDLLVNVAVALPLGFFLSGAVLSGRTRRRPGPVVIVMLVACITAILDIGIELVQILAPERYSSWADVMIQGLAAGVGGVVWVGVGPALMAWMRRLASEREPDILATAFLWLYMPAYAFLQLATPGGPVAATSAEQPLRVNLPWGLLGSQAALGVDALRVISGQLVLNVPIGMFAALTCARRGTQHAGGAILAGVLVVATVEVAQLLLWSRAARASDVLAGAAGVCLGVALTAWWARLRLAEPIPRHRLVSPWLLSATIVWGLVLIGHYWYPFDFNFDAEFLAGRRIKKFPFSAYYPGYATVPLIGLKEIVARTLLGVPLGLLLRMSWRGRESWPPSVAVMVIGTGVLLVIECGQVFLPTRFPDVTDVLFGVTGVLIGTLAGAALCRCEGAPLLTSSEAGSAGPTLTIR